MNEKLQPNNKGLSKNELVAKFEMLPKKIVNKLVSSTSNLSIEKEDLIQEAYIELITCYNKYDETKGDFEKFATSCICNRTKDLLRKHSYTNAAPSEEIIDIVDSNGAYAIDTLIQEAEEDELYKKMIDFVNNHKLVKIKDCDPAKIIYMLANGMNTREIADAFGVSTQTIASFVRRFRDKALTSKEYNEFKENELCL